MADVKNEVEDKDAVAARTAVAVFGVVVVLAVVALVSIIAVSNCRGRLGSGKPTTKRCLSGRIERGPRNGDRRGISRTNRPGRRALEM